MISGEFKALSRRTSDLERLRARLLSRTALCGVLSIGMLLGLNYRPANAGPKGTTVASGKVTIKKSGNHTQFKQSSGTAILNHSSFDIRSNESVHFQQPGTNALAVNRVVGSDIATSIAGKLTANGNVWVLNPSGVAISNTARINVNGLLATTAKISDRDILAGRASGSYAFSGAADGTAITNAGSIAAGDGHVVLVAPVVENSGTITTKGSDIALGAGSGFTVDMSLDGLTRFEVKDGDAVSLTNSGTLSAEGGAVYLSAAEASAVESAVVSIGGEVEATRIENRGGKIVISGGRNGVTEVSGKIDASQASGNGGQIVITGDLVDIKGTALIDASGAAGGGKIEIGGGYQGRAVDTQVVRTASASAPDGAPLPVAKRTAVREGAVIRANAGTVGDGGEVIVWADEATWYHGQLEAKGGLELGDGGFTEISGKISLDLQGDVDLTALNGSTGVLLLDPFDILIADGGTASGGDITFDGAVSGTTTLDASYINDQTANASLILQAENDITIDEAISTTNADVDVSFAAGRNIVVNEDVAVTGDLVMSAGDAGAASPDAAGTVDFSGGGAVSGASVTIETAGGVTLGGITSPDVTINAGGSIDQLASTSVVATTSFDVTATDTVTLDQTDNDFGTVAISAAGQAVTLVDTNDISVVSVTADSLSVQADNGIEAVEAARVAMNLSVPTLTLIDTEFGTPVGPNPVYRLRGAGTTSDTTRTLNVNELVSAGVTDLTFETTDPSRLISLDEITAPTLNLTLATPSGVLVGDGTTELQNLTSTSTNAFGDAAGADAVLEVSGTASITASAILFNNGPAQNFGTLVANVPSIEFIEADSISLGDISATEISISAGGAIDQVAGSTIVTTGAVDLISSGDVTLGEAGNDFQAAVNVDTSGDAIALTDANSILLGDIDGSSLSVTAGGTVSQGAGTSIVASGTASVTATGDVTLDDSDNDFGGAVSVTTTADAIVLRDTNAVTLGALSGSSLDVTADASITDTDDQAISITGATTLEVTTAGSDILLDDDGDTSNTELHAFGGLVTIDGDPGNVEIQTQGTLSVSAIAVDDNGADTVVLGAAADIVLGGAIDALETTLENNAGGTIDLGNDNGATTHISDATLDIAGDNVVIRGESTILVDGASAGGGQDVTLSTTGGTVRFENTASTFSGDLGVAAGGSVTQDVAVTVSGDADIAAAGQTVDLSNTSNDFAGTVDVEGADVTLRDQNSIEFGDATVTGNLDVAATGIINDVSGGNVSVTGTTSLVAGDDIRFNVSQHQFDGLVTLSADQILDFRVTGSISFGTITATNATGVQNTITKIGAGTVDFTEQVTIGATSDLQIRSSGDVTQSNNGAISADLLRLNANNTSANFILDGDNDVNTLQTAGAANASVTLVDIDGVDLESIEVANLSVTAGGTINDTTANAISVTGDTTLTAVDAGGTNFFDILLDEENTHDFGGSFSAIGEDVVVDDQNALALGTITTHLDATADTSSDTLALTDPVRFVDLAGNDGDLIVRSRGAITDTDGEVITANGLTSLLAQDGADFFDIDLNETHAFSTTSVLNASGEQVRIATGNGALAGTITADGGSDDPTLDVALSRSFLTATEFLAIDAGDIDLSGFDVSSALLNLPGGGALAIRGLTSVSSFTTLGASHVQLDSAGAGITLSGLSISADTFTVSSSNSETGTVGSVFTEGDDITFSGANSITGDFRAISGDDIVQTAGSSISVSGTTYLLAADSIVGNADQSISLSGSSNDFQGTVDAIASGAITLTDANDIDLGLVSAGFGETDTSGSGRDLTVTAGGTITQQDGGDRQIFFRGGDDAAGTVDTNLDRAIDSQPDYTDVLDSARVEAADSATFVTANTIIGFVDRSDVLLDNADNDFDRLSSGGTAAVDPVTATGEDIVLLDRDALALGNVTAAEGFLILPDTSSDALSGTYPLLSGNDGDLIISAGGLISQETGTSISAADASSISSSGDITLDQAGNSLQVVDLAGGAIVLNETGNVVLGSVDATSLDVTAGGTITDDGVSASAADDIVVSGVTTLVSGGAIDLDDGFHDFGTVEAAANGGLSAFEVHDSNAVTLGDISASTVSVDAGGGIDQVAGGTIDASTSVDLISGGNVTLGGIDAPSLDVSATGTITDDGISGSVADDVSISGITSLVSGGDIVLDDGFHDLTTVNATANGGLSNFELNDTDSVTLSTLSASTATVTAGTDVVLGGVSVTGLDITAGGAITDDGITGSAALDVVVSGVTTLTSGSDIDLDDDFHDFATVIATANAGNSAFELDESSGVTFGNLAASTVSIDAGGTIDQLGGSSITASSTADITALGAVTLGEADNDFESTVHISATGNSIVLNDADDVILGGISGSNLTVTAGGTIRDTSSAISVTGTTSLMAVDGGGTEFFDILLDTADTHNFGSVVSASGEDIVLDDLNALLLGTVTTHDDAVADTSSDALGLPNLAGNDGDLIVNAGGALSQEGGTSIIASGVTDITAAADVTLSEADNDFGSVVHVDTTADAIALTDSNGIILGAVDGSSLTVSAAGTIEDTTDAILITGATSLTAVDSGGTEFFDILLDTADTHDFGAVVSASGEDIVLDDLNALLLGAVTTHDDAVADTTSDALTATFPNLTGNDGDLIVNAGGTLSQSAGTSIIASGVTDITADGGVTLGQSGNDFEAAVNVDTTADAIVLADSDNIILGAIDGSSLTVTAGGTITDTADAISVTGTTSLTAVDSGGTEFFDILLDTADTHDFVGAISASGEDIVLDDVNDLLLGAVTTHDDAVEDTASDALTGTFPNLTGNDGDLIVNAGGTLSQVGGTSIIASGVTDITVDGNVTLDQTSNDFQDVVHVDTTADSIVLYDTNDIILGGVDGASLNVSVGGSITDDGVSGSVDDDVSISGDTTLTSGDVIELDDPNHDFNVVAGSANSGGSAFELESTSGVTLDNILASTVSVTASGGEIDQVTGTSIVATDTADFTSAGDITLDQADNDFQSVVDASGNTITLYDTNEIILGEIDGASLTVNAGGTITDTADAISVTGATSLTAVDSGGTEFFDILLDTADTHDFGSVVSASGEDIVLDDVNALLLGTVTTHDDATEDTASDALALPNLTGNNGDLIVNAGGTVSQDSGTSITASGETDIAADGNVTLDQSGNDFQSTVDVEAATYDIELVDSNALILGGMEGASLSVAAGGGITDDGVSGTGEDITITGSTTLTSGGDIVLDDDAHEFFEVTATSNAGNSRFELDESTALTLGNLSASTVSISAGDVIDQITGTSIVASGTADFTSTSDIILDQTDNDFQVSLGLSGVALEVVDRNSLTFDDVTGTTVSVNAGGTIDQVTGSSIVASDTVDVTAASDVTLDQSGNDFQSVVDVDTSGDAIVLRDTNSIVLGGVDGSSLLVRAGGGITDDGVSGTSEDVSISGIATLTSGGDIILDDDGHEFGTVIVSANSGASAFELDESSALTFGAVRASNISVDAGGAIDQISGTSIVATSTAEFTSPVDIQLNQTGNDFQSRVDAFGRVITLVDGNSLLLGDIDAAGNLTVRAVGGSISDAGTASSSAGGIDVAGVTSLSASGDITLDDLGNDFDSGDTGNGALGRVNATGDDIALTDEDAIILGRISANSLTVNAAGSITDTSGQAIAVTGRTSLTAQDGGDVFNIALDNADRHDFGGSLSATGNNITIDDNNNLILGTIDSAGTLTIRANGAIDDTAGENITIGGDASFASSSGVQLLIRSVDGTVDVIGRENVVSVADGNFRLGSTALTGDSVFDALSGNLVLTQGHSVSGGSLFLIAEAGNVDMSGISLAGNSGPVLSASETVAILAPNGSIVMPDDIGANSFQVVAGGDAPTLTLSDTDLSDASISPSRVNGVTSAVAFEFARDLLITVPTSGAAPANGVLDLDTTGTVRFTMNGTSDFAIGEDAFVSQVGTLDFDPLQFIGNLNDDQLLLSIDGSFHLVITEGVHTFNVQNTTSVLGSSNIGSGTIITGPITIEVLGGELLQFATFGSVAGRDSQNAAIGTVTLINFVPDGDSTINGCVIGAISSCTPLGTVILNLQFETGQFLGIAFVDPDEDEDDPFSNRGDEEEWE